MLFCCLIALCHFLPNSSDNLVFIFLITSHWVCLLLTSGIPSSIRSIGDVYKLISQFKQQHLQHYQLCHCQQPNEHAGIFKNVSITIELNFVILRTPLVLGAQLQLLDFRLHTLVCRMDFVAQTIFCHLSVPNNFNILLLTIYFA